MNYQVVRGTLAYQEAKHHQWKAVPYDELVRLALLGIEYERKLTQQDAQQTAETHGIDPDCPNCDGTGGSGNDGSCGVCWKWRTNDEWAWKRPKSLSRDNEAAIEDSMRDDPTQH